jgi:hypothetical protein
MRPFLPVAVVAVALPLAALAADPPSAVPAPAAAVPAPGDEGRLKALVEKTGLKAVALDDAGESFGVPFEPRATKGRKAWVVAVQYANPASRKFVLVFAVMLKLADADEVPKRLLKAAMEYNNRVPGSKLAWNRKDGTLDVQYEIPAHLATPEVVAWAVNDVAATCDDHHDRFAELAAE